MPQALPSLGFSANLLLYSVHLFLNQTRNCFSFIVTSEWKLKSVWLITGNVVTIHYSAHNIVLQETQLSLTNRATRFVLEVGEGHQTWYHSIC